ncbi:putative transcription factor WD40-like family [Helianthus anomalus]
MTSDEEDNHQHRSTVDELLLIDSDGSDVNSPRSNTNNPFDANSSDYMPLTTSQLGTDGDRPEMHSRIPSTSQLPRLFSTVRSNAKLGAALAAAAAASRLVPTPHVAAIKLTREKSCTESLDPKANIDSEIGHSEAKLVDEDLNTITRTISSSSFKQDHGTPQALAVHLNYFAVGMSRGLIVVVPRKYSPHYADNMDAKMLMLGLQGDRPYATVTSMSFNHQGDLFAGYTDGYYTVWDVQRVSAAKIVTEHKAQVVHMLYLGMDSQVTRQFNTVSGDSKGVVKLIHLSPFSWLSRFFASKTATLLDESTSTVVCASPLLPEENFVSTLGGGLTSAEEGVVIFITHQSALVAKVISNTPEVYAQLPRPDGVREGSMLYAAWKYIAPSQGSAAGNVEIIESAIVPLLAIAWDHQVQVAKLVKLELKVYAKWTLDSSAIGIAWLDDQMLVVLTSVGQFCGGRGDDVIGHHTHFSDVLGKSHHNCIAFRGASLYLLGPTHLVVSRLLLWKERIEVLRRGGDWMCAFNMAMMLYDGEAHGVFDLPRALDDVRKVITSYLMELLLAYVNEVFSYIYQ